MTPQITLETSTIERLKTFAEPLVDTFDTVVNRAMMRFRLLRLPLASSLVHTKSEPMVTPSVYSSSAQP